MPRYRANLIETDNRVHSYKAIDAESDEKALDAAKRLVDGHDVELWFLDRMIGRLNKQA